MNARARDDAQEADDSVNEVIESVERLPAASVQVVICCGWTMRDPSCSWEHRQGAAERSRKRHSQRPRPLYAVMRCQRFVASNMASMLPQSEWEEKEGAAGCPARKGQG